MLSAKGSALLPSEESIVYLHTLFMKKSYLPITIKAHTCSTHKTAGMINNAGHTRLIKASTKIVKKNAEALTSMPDDIESQIILTISKKKRLSMHSTRHRKDKT